MVATIQNNEYNIVMTQPVTKTFGMDIQESTPLKIDHNIWNINPEYITKEKDESLILKVNGYQRDEKSKVWVKILKEKGFDDDPITMFSSDLPKHQTDLLSTWLRQEYNAGLEKVGEFEFDIIFSSMEDKVQFQLTWLL